MYNTIGVITNKPESDILRDLTKYRSINTVPFGGRYRLIDFALSNMVNSGLKTIGVIGSYKYRSLVDHLGTGQEWSLSRKKQGLSILNGGVDHYIGSNPRINLIDLYSNLDFFIKTSQKNVIISESDVVCNINFKKVLRFHEENDADITLIHGELGDLDENQQNEENELMLKVNESTKTIEEIGYDCNGECNHLFLDMLIIKKDLLLQILYGSKNSKKSLDLIPVIKNHLMRLRILGYPFTGYYHKVNSVNRYFQSSMDLLRKEVKEELFCHEDKVLTKINDNHPTRYLKAAKTKNAMVASGCILGGCVDHSIIFRQVHIKAGANVKNSVLMQRCSIGKGSVLENVILDKEVKIGDGVVLKGQKGQPIVIGKGSSIG